MLLSKSSSMRTQVENKFRDFFEKWMSQLEDFFHLLRQKPECFNDSDFNALVNKVTQHHKDYYTAKWACAHDNVSAFFNPVWLSPLENAYSWMTGWKPSTVFSIIDSMNKDPPHSSSSMAAVGFTDQQLQSIEWLRGRIRKEEDKVEREMERQQVSIADRKMVGLTRLVSAIKNGERTKSPQVDAMVEAAVNALMTGMETVVKMADCVRLKSLKGILDLLSPVQSVDFLAASAMLLIEMRKVGKRRENLYSITG